MYLNVFAFICIIIVALLIGFLIGKRVGSQEGMEQFLSILRVYDKSGRLLKNIENLLVEVERLSPEEKRERFHSYLQKQSEMENDK